MLLLYWWRLPLRLLNGAAACIASFACLLLLTDVLRRVGQP